MYKQIDNVKNIYESVRPHPRVLSMNMEVAVKSKSKTIIEDIISLGEELQSSIKPMCEFKACSLISQIPKYKMVWHLNDGSATGDVMAVVCFGNGIMELSRNEESHLINVKTGHIYFILENRPTKWTCRLALVQDCLTSLTYIS